MGLKVSDYTDLVIPSILKELDSIWLAVSKVDFILHLCFNPERSTTVKSRRILNDKLAQR